MADLYSDQKQARGMLAKGLGLYRQLFRGSVLSLPGPVHQALAGTEL